MSPNTVTATVIPDHGECVMSYAVGTPPVKVYGIVDTGSDMIWMQCKRCTQCYSQVTPLFDPSKSKSYKAFSCRSNTCHSVLGSYCYAKRCQYHIDYGDATFSYGDLSVETLTLGSTNGSLTLLRTAIGCGHINFKVLKGTNSGIVGLGRGPVSLINQLGPSVGWKFSYCLVPETTLHSNSTSKLSFGDAAVVNGPGTVSTQLFGKPGEVFYLVTLEGLSVGIHRAEFGSSLAIGGDDGNMVIDTGTTVTLLPDDFYTWLEITVAHEVKSNPIKDPNLRLSLCYNGTLDELDIPVITAHFRGANVVLNPSSTFIEVADGVLCLAFERTQTHAVLGNLAQQNLLVGYDLQKNTVSFQPTDCTKI